jgi:hypothetical protein
MEAQGWKGWRLRSSEPDISLLHIEPLYTAGFRARAALTFIVMNMS